MSRTITADDIPWDLPADAEPMPADDAIELVTDLVVDVGGYRLLAQQAIHALYRLGRDHAALEQRYEQLLAELRAMRAAA